MIDNISKFQNAQYFAENPSETNPFVTQVALNDNIASILAKATGNTGIISGGALTINADPTKFNLAEGKGFIIDHSTYPSTVTLIEWAEQLAVVVTNLATSFATDIAINISGAIVQQNSFTNTELRSLILLGGLDHSNQTNIIRTFEVQVPSIGVGSSLKELSKAIGDINISGNVFAPNGANLKINKSVGTAFKFGSSNTSTPNDPHTKDQPLLTQATFSYVFDDGSGNGVFQTPTTDVNPTNYDDGSGTLASVSGNNFTIQRILLFPNSNNVFIQYGTDTFTNKANATSGLSTQSFPALTGIRPAIVRGYLLVRANATTLNNTSQAVFIEADRFGGIGSRDGGGGVVDWGNILGTLSNQTDLQTALDNKVTLDTTQTITGQKTFDGTLQIKEEASVAVLLLRRANGTEASPTAIAIADPVAVIQSQGYNGSAFQSARDNIIVAASENWTPTANGTFMDFQVVTNGTTTNRKAIRSRFGLHQPGRSIQYS